MQATSAEEHPRVRSATWRKSYYMILSQERTALETAVLCVDKSDGTVEIGSSNSDPLSKMSDPRDTEETVDIMEGVLVKATGTRSGVSRGVGTGVVEGARSEGEGTVGGGDGDGVTDAENDTDTLAVGVTVGDDDE
jgi:hypothetical protein